MKRIPLSLAAQATRERLARMPPAPTPPTARECFRGHLLAYGLSPSRRTMSPAHQLELVERYPGLYRHADDPPVSSCTPFAREGFACGDGWFEIIDHLSIALVADPGLIVAQLKEKMGLLTVYFGANEERTPPPLDSALDAAVDAAREESRYACEVCGDPGTLESRLRGWYSVRCEPCDWLDDIEESCRRLAACTEGMELAAFTADALRIDAAKLHIKHLGEAARHQSPERRARQPGIDWARLDLLQSLDTSTAMGAADVWDFIRDAVPALAEALR